MSEEVRLVSETGGEKGSKPCQLFSAPPAAMLALGCVMGFGAEKYDLWNYRKGIPHSLLINAAYRHMLAHIDGETLDPESGHPHLAHAMADLAMVIQSFEDHGDRFDDRHRPAPVLKDFPPLPEHVRKDLDSLGRL